MSITISDLGFEYKNGNNKVKALSNISITIEYGSFTAIVGETGSGKSTLLRILAGFENGYSGKINLGELKKSDIRMVFQYPEYQLFEDYVLKDVMFGPKNMGLSPEEAEDKAIWALDTVGLEEKYWDRSPFKLSGGQKRLVAIAGILAMKPKVVLLDESTAGLDPFHARKIMEIFKQLNSEGTTVIIVTHSMEDVLEYADFVVALNRGRVMTDGKEGTVNTFEYFTKCVDDEKNVPNSIKLLSSLHEKGYNVHVDRFKYEESIEEVIRMVREYGGANWR
ncbi:MAG: ATP-binding cassette domain-containing protein [Lachnospiraceae bacterium]|nr:ATP-binding cassette domain-containing protein [Lachnospiraceae bacterium]